MHIQTEVCHQKPATDSIRHDVITHNVGDCTFLRTVEVPHPSCTVPVIKTISSFKYETWAHYLRNYLDCDKAKMLLNYIKNGVPIGYNGPQISDVQKNWPSVNKFESKVRYIIPSDIKQGRIAGLFREPPFRYYRACSMGAFHKKRSQNIRLVYDLSYPPNSSVNYYVPDSS